MRLSRPTREADGANRGFTLLEIMVALSILATALVGLLSLHGRNIQSVAYDRDLNRASLLAQRTMTQTLIESPFPDPAELDGAFDDDPRFHWEVRIAEGPPPDLEDELREVQVRVWWDPADRDAVKLITHLRKPDQ
jgi:general secretion pathway protein I